MKWKIKHVSNHQPVFDHFQPLELRGAAVPHPMSQSPASGCANPPFSSANDQVTNSFVHGLVENCGNGWFSGRKQLSILLVRVLGGDWWLLDVDVSRLPTNPTAVFWGPLGTFNSGPSDLSGCGFLVTQAMGSMTYRQLIWPGNGPHRPLNGSSVQPKSKRVIAGVNFQLSTHMSHFVWSSQIVFFNIFLMGNHATRLPAATTNPWTACATPRCLRARTYCDGCISRHGSMYRVVAQHGAVNTWDRCHDAHRCDGPKKGQTWDVSPGTAAENIWKQHFIWVNYINSLENLISWLEPEEYWSSLFRRLSDLSFRKPLFLRASKKAGQNLYRTFLQTHHSISPCFGWVMLGLSPFVLLKNSETTQIRSIPTYHLTWQLHWPTAPTVHARHCHWHWVWSLGSCRWGQCISPQSSAPGWWLIMINYDDHDV